MSAGSNPGADVVNFRFHITDINASLQSSSVVSVENDQMMPCGNKGAKCEGAAELSAKIKILQTKYKNLLALLDDVNQCLVEHYACIGCGNPDVKYTACGGIEGRNMCEECWTGSPSWSPCSKCHLIECCCEADRQQVIEDDAKRVIFDELELTHKFNKRLLCWEKVGKTMMEAISGDRAKGKGSRNRKRFVSGLRRMLRRFPTEEEEYQCINKFGRGIWEQSIVESFNQEEQSLIIDVIAVEMGAFDY